MGLLLCMTSVTGLRLLMQKHWSTEFGSHKIVIVKELWNQQCFWLVTSKISVTCERLAGKKAKNWHWITDANSVNCLQQSSVWRWKWCLTELSRPSWQTSDSKKREDPVDLNQWPNWSIMYLERDGNLSSTHMILGDLL